MCGMVVESVTHTLFRCDRVMSVWMTLLLAWRSLDFDDLENRGWIDKFMKLSVIDSATTCVGAWSIWGDHNKLCL